MIAPRLPTGECLAFDHNPAGQRAPLDAPGTTTGEHPGRLVPTATAGRTAFHTHFLIVIPRLM